MTKRKPAVPAGRSYARRGILLGAALLMLTALASCGPSSDDLEGTWNRESEGEGFNNPWNSYTFSGDSYTYARNYIIEAIETDWTGKIIRVHGWLDENFDLSLAEDTGKTTFGDMIFQMVTQEGTFSITGRTEIEFTPSNGEPYTRKIIFVPENQIQISGQTYTRAPSG